MKLIIPVQTVDGLLDTSNVAEAQPPEPAEWLTATAYDFGDEVAVVLGTNAATITHGIYKSQAEGIGTNTGNDPTTQGTDVTKWKLTNATARWRMFNNVLQQQTTKDSIIGNVDLPGAAGDHASELNSGLNSTPVDIEIIIKLNPDDFSPVNAEEIGSKWQTTGNQRSWLTRFQSGSTGKVQFIFSNDGTAEVSVLSLALLPITAKWMRVKHLANNGAAGNDTTFEYSTQTTKISSEITWIAFGASVTTATVSTIFNSSAKILVGGQESGGSPLNGNIEIMEVYSGIDPDTQILVSDFNVDRDYVSGSTMNSSLMAADLPGAGGDVITTPNASANRITGNIKIAFRARLDDYTPSSAEDFVTKYTSSGNQRAYNFRLNTTGRPTFIISELGTSASNVVYNANAAPSVTNGDLLWWQVDLDVDNGSSNSDCVFSISTTDTDNYGDVIWSQLGGVRQSGSIESIFASSSIVRIGGESAGSELNGNIRRVLIFDDGTVVADMSPKRDYISGNTMTSSTTGEVYTANGNAKFVGQWTANGNAEFIAGIPGIVVEVIPGVSTNAVAFMNIDATSVTVVMTDPIDGEVFNQTFNVLSLLGIDDWWPWLFKPIERDINLVVFGLPTYINATIKATIASPDTTKCGQMVLGVEYDMGFSQYDAAYGIKNYSQKNVDEDTGAVTITAGAFKSVGDINVVIESNRFSAVLNTLTGLRNTPVVWVAEGSVSGTIQYGFFNTFDLVYSNFTFANCLLTIEGL